MTALPFLPESFDVIIFDSVGTPFVGSTPRFGGLGGSELQEILLAEGLAKAGLNVMCINNTPYGAYQNGVWYFSPEVFTFRKFKTKSLITLRSSQIPMEYIDFDKHFVWLTDLPNPNYNIVAKMVEERPSTHIITVSQWHNGTFPAHWNKTFIYNQIPDQVYDLKEPRAKDRIRFIYASAAQKGLDETVQFWKMIKKEYAFKKSELTVLSPGYDRPSKEALDSKINFKGAMPFHDTVREIASNNAMLYVNKLPETFGISPVLAEIAGTPPFVLCLQNPGALTETLNNPFVTNDQQQYFQWLLDFSKNPNKFIGPAKDFRTSKIMPIWREVLSI